MITDRYSVFLSIPLKSGGRAEAELKFGDQSSPLSVTQALEVQKLLKTAAGMGDVELYANIIHTKTDDNFKAV